MDDSHDQNKNQTDGAQQGIFSTPELTVDTEKIAEDTQAAAAASRAKIASIFANTETGQQAQRLNDAMIANSEPATEDIVIDNGPKKKSKLPIVLAVLVLIVAVGGVVGWMMMGKLSQPTQKEEILAKYQEYIEYLQDGPEDFRDNEESGDTDELREPDSWFLMELDDLDLPLDTQKSYAEGLRERYNDFSDLLIPNSKSSSVGDIVNNYSTSLSAAIKLSTINLAYDELLRTYLEQGASGAYRFVESIRPQGDEVSVADAAMISLSRYLETQLTLIEIYDAHSCIVNNMIDEVCEESLILSGQAYSDTVRDQDRAYRSMNQSLRLVGSDLSAGTEQLRALAEAINE